MPRSRTLRAATPLAGAAALALALTGCGADPEEAASAEPSPIIVGTTEPVTHLDPAGSYDAGSLTLQTQVFPYLLNTAPGSGEVVPDLAESAEFTSPTQYTVTLPAGLTWANGHELTSSDVKFSFDRQLGIAAEEGPSALLANITWVETPDEHTVVFNLRTEYDRTFPRVLTGSAGAIVDEETFSAYTVTSDAAIVGGRAFGGPYSIQMYTFNESVELIPNANYTGLVDPAQNVGVRLDYFDGSADLKRAVQDRDVDIAYRGLSSADVEELAADEDLTVHEGPAAEEQVVQDLPIVPTVEGTQVVVAAADVDGIELDASSKLRMSTITR